MSDESRKRAERLATAIFGRNIFAWNEVFRFRWMGQLGLPHAAAQVARQERTSLYGAEAVAKHFQVSAQVIIDQGYVDLITGSSVTAFEAALDGASLIFAHSVLDSVIFDWCRVCALAQPEDLLSRVGPKKVSLSDVQGAESFSELLNIAIDGYLNGLERESLIKKLELLFALCRPPSNFEPIEKYHYDRERIVALDNLRHDYVHRGTPGRRVLPRGADDLWFMLNTTNFLVTLVDHRYGIRPSPSFFKSGGDTRTFAQSVTYWTRSIPRCE